MLYTLEEVSKHKKRDDCWIILYNEVYDITKFMKNEHSGGYVPLSVSGKRATNMFISTHPMYATKFLKPGSSFYKKYHVGTLVKKERVKRDDKQYFELKKEVEQYVNDRDIKVRDITMFDIQIVMFIVASIYSYVKLMKSNRPFLLSLAHGTSVAYTFARTYHDCNHGGLSKKQWKRYIFTFVNEIFSTNQWWQEKHNSHHMDPNDPDKDPDMMQTPYIRVSYDQKLEKQYKFQHIYYAPLYTLFIVSNVLGLNLKNQSESELVHHYSRVPAKIVMVLYYYHAIRSKKLMYIILSQLLTGFMLTSTFAVNHVHEELTGDNRDNTSFLTEQLTTAIDYRSGSKLVNFLSHGLNHQTLHHLFPSFNQLTYPRLTTDVLIPFCRKNGLPYNSERTFSRLFRRHVKSLYKFGRNEGFIQ